MTEFTEIATAVASNISYNPVNKFLSSYKANGDPEANIIDQGRNKCAYKVPLDRLDELFTLLENQRKAGSRISLSEKQTCDSCLFIDFDFKQSSEIRAVTEFTACDLMRECVKIYASLVKGDQTRTIHYSVFIRNSIETTPTGIVKDGIHGIIHVRMTRIQRIAICKLIKQSNIVASVFDDDVFINGPTSFDENSATVPVLFYGCSQVNKNPYKYVGTWPVKIKNSTISSSTYPQLKTDDINMIREMSMGFGKDSEIKRTNIPLDVKEYDIIEEKQEEKIIVDDSHIKNVIDLLSQKRTDDPKDWFIIMTALANIGGGKNKPLALYFTNKRRDDNGNLTNGRKRFENTWSQVICNGSKYHYSIRTLYKMAKEDNPDGYKNVYDEELISKLTKTANDPIYCGDVMDTDFAETFHILYGDKYIYDIDNKEWYMFIEIGSEDDKKGYGGKWKKGAQNSVILGISKDLPVPYRSVIDRMVAESDKIEDIKSVAYKWNKQVIAQLRKSIKRCGMSASTKGILEACTRVFGVSNFTSFLDTNNDEIGVLNGVLSIKKIPTLLTSGNTYVSRCVNARWIPDIDEYDSDLYEVFNSIYELFLDHEKDAFHYLMFYFSYTIVGAKLCQMLIITGSGSNGKTYFQQLLANMLRNSTSGGYSASLNIQYLTTVFQSIGRANSDLYAIKNARFVYMSESNKGEYMNVQALKQIVSQDTIAMRRNYGDIEQVSLTASVSMSTNFPPRLNSTTYSDTRRLSLMVLGKRAVNKPVEEYDIKQNRLLVDEWVNDERKHTALFNLLVRYLVILRNRPNFDIDNVSPTVNRHTRDWRHTDDTIGCFISARIVKTTNSKSSTPMHSLIDDYIQFYKENIKDCKHDRSDILSMFSNSLIGKFIHSEEKNTMKKCLIGHRCLGYDEEPSEGETYIDNNKSSPYEKINDPTPPREVLAKIIREYNSYVN